jgi:hypothetical protein
VIISASRRTDIPAFYSEWFMRRIQQQYCLCVNPYNRKQVTRVSLRPEDVDALVFWTKNAEPILSRLQELDVQGYRYYFQYTLNGYGEPFEPKLPELDHCIETFQKLSERIGSERVIWRYDPVVFSSQTSVAYHQQRFGHILERLQASTRRIVISIVDEYRKATYNFKRLQAQGVTVQTDYSAEQLASLCAFMSEQARQHNIPVYSCAENIDLMPFGISPGKCVDGELITRLFGIQVKSGKDRSQRKECGCLQSKDIGVYDTCLYGCTYCYAGTQQSGVRNRLKHEVDSPLLNGNM